MTNRFAALLLLSSASIYAETVSLEFGSGGTLTGNLYLNGATDFVRVQNVGVTSVCTTNDINCLIANVIASYALPVGSVMSATTGARQTPNPLTVNTSTGAFDVTYNAPAIANLGVFSGLSTLLGDATPVPAKISFQPGVAVTCASATNISGCRAVTQNTANFQGRLVTGSFTFERAIDFATLDPAIAAALQITTPLTGILPLKLNFNGRFAYAGTTTGPIAGSIYRLTGPVRNGSTPINFGATFSTGSITLDAPSSIPEPSTFGFAGMALAAAAVALRRRR